MDSDVLAFGQVMFVIITSLAAILGISLGARILWRFSSRVPERVAPRSTDSAEIERLQNSVDAIAIEVERISEAQRFTVTLLSDRLPPAGAGRVAELPPHGTKARVDTPH